MAAITGFHAIEESLRSSGRGGTLYVAGKGPRIEKLIDTAKSAGVTVRNVGTESLNKLAAGREHRGAVYVTAGIRPKVSRDLSAISRIESENGLALVLDRISDPHNLGAVLRSADLFEVDLVVLPSDRSAQLSPTVVKTSAGASNYVPVVTTPNIARALQEFKKAGFWIYGADAGGVPADELDLSGKVCLVMGSEGRGIGRLVREQCDETLAIPVRGNIDSLNVSVAAGICMYEVRRQQGFSFLHS
ncbi:MAG: 23S rRNA (guanosine(2251)-2'-O)-methyltransferase RlmB [Spirochaetales bacterium]|nr:23S rRNA (guanosine(2251)-2'-O)-methyltransferase RlmB [Spirochaetales bacterium]